MPTKPANLSIEARNKLRQAIHTGDFSGVGQITKPEVLLAELYAQSTVIDFIARRGLIKSVAPEALTDEVLTHPGIDDFTAMHHLAYNGHFADLPEQRKTEANFTVRSSPGGLTPLHIAVNCGYTYLLPEGMINERTLAVRTAYGDTLMHDANRSGRWAARKSGAKDAPTPSNRLPAESPFKGFKPEHFNDVTLCAPNCVGMTPAHMGAIYHHLDEYPQHAFTAKVLNTVDTESGLTVLALATRARSLNQIPAQALKAAGIEKAVPTPEREELKSSERTASEPSLLPEPVEAEVKKAEVATSSTSMGMVQGSFF